MDRGPGCRVTYEIDVRSRSTVSSTCFDQLVQAGEKKDINSEHAVRSEAVSHVGVISG